MSNKSVRALMLTTQLMGWLVVHGLTKYYNDAENRLGILSSYLGSTIPLFLEE